MKIYNSLFYLLAIVFTLTFTACSDDSNNNTDNPEANQLLVGEWLLLSESTYLCGTTQHTGDTQCCLADLDDVFVFNQDGTWGEYNNGTYEQEATEYEQRGTWEYLDGDSYRIYWESDDISEITIIQFEGNDSMKFGISECWEATVGSIYSFDVLERQ